MKYELIEKNENFIVVNKPAGLLTHAAAHIKEESLIDLVTRDYPEIKKVGDDAWRPGLVHRLDKSASGLLVIARNQDAFESLKKQFKERTIIKRYSALVYGKIAKDEDKIEFPIQRSAKGYKMAALPTLKKGEPNNDGRQALSEFTVKERFINYTLVKVRIKTGRTHQIRVHMAAYGNPLVGDELYSTKKTKVKNAKLELGRIFLVADELEFTDIDGEKKSFKIDLPKDLKKFLKNLPIPQSKQTN